MLVPAGFVVLLILGAIAFDLARLSVTRRQLIDMAASAANDAAALAIVSDGYRSGGVVADDELASALVQETLALQGADSVRGDARIVTIDGSPAVVVSMEIEVRSLFARGLPGGWASQRVRVESTALLDIF